MNFRFINSINCDLLNSCNDSLNAWLEFLPVISVVQLSTPVRFLFPKDPILRQGPGLARCPQSISFEIGCSLAARSSSRRTALAKCLSLASFSLLACVFLFGGLTSWTLNRSFTNASYLPFQRKRLALVVLALFFMGAAAFFVRTKSKEYILASRRISLAMVSHATVDIVVIGVCSSI